MWTLRRTLRVSWVDHVWNEDILQRAGLMERDIGYILRGEGYSFQRLILKGKIEGGRRIGRRKLS